jgi:4-hydroxy-2-oxoglutarate aldolase
MSKPQITGVIPPMATPFTRDGEVDFDAHVHNMALWNEHPLAGYLALGSNSEAVYLTEREKLRLIELTAEYAAPGRLVMAGTGMESTRETIHLTREAARAGAQAALVVTPFYYKDQMTDQALIAHFSKIADDSPIPVLIYNVVKFTGISISVKALEILSRHGNIAGMKDSSGNIPLLVQYQAVAAGDFNLLVGTASAWYPALTLGVKGIITALANCAPAECIKVQTLFDKGQRAEAEALYRRLFPLNHAVTATYGVPGLKYACALRGYRSGYVRSPLMELDDREKGEVKGIVEDVLMG